ncbi:hypothetical protein CKM354_000045300 [Cercospora kikuchii]|uniref:CID domain-containing protein n=1 Tax=Cercospora kikuchii TaxID=84275 RepID=A0A9P3FBM3_9PEZI|nr:uncharacterized protein CKM354_000045300 [Cercospora kikuchii]GIZ36989.1 hypothetical protein CKM354_000045300 [Cercospora kikuchii]
MSSRSPRGSFSGGSSAEVAADFEESLKDLQSNNRYEISNLTVIAKENTEHAQAISKALENHIKQTSPTRKLPALFVLDSIVKNVGTPYTVYLGRNLYNTFMEAYTLVDNATRRHMDAMLRTWKEPVPGSIDPRPVFPRETVQPLENAMIKARAALEKIRQSQTQFQGVATPPQQNRQYPRPPSHTPQPMYPGHPVPQATPQSQPYAYQPPLTNLNNEIESVKRDIDSLIPRFQYQLASRPHDVGLQTQFNALNQLRNLLNIQRVSSSELQQIKQQVSSLAPAVPAFPPPVPPPQVPQPQWQTPTPLPLAFQPPLPIPTATPSHAGPPPNLTPDALNGLQALLAGTQKPSTPQLRAAIPGFHNASHSQLNAVQSHTSSAPQANDAADLIASLTKAGLIKPVSSAAPPANPVATAPAASDPTTELLKSLQAVAPLPSQAATPLQSHAQPVRAHLQVPITAASLKTFRPELVAAMYDALPNQCSTCGRRFPTTEEGRQKKSLHLDWHFRTNQRIADPNTNRGHHRNWFPNEMEWIQHIEFDPSTTTATAKETTEAAKAQKSPQEQVVRAPAGMTKSTCTICYEDLHSTYSEEHQDWVFANAGYMNKKIVHATCLAELTKSQPVASIDRGALAAALASVSANQRERSSTPDSSLGKRKAETEMAGNGPRIKMQ